MPFQFNIGRDDLLRAISAQQNITSKKGTLAILSNVLVEVSNDQVVFTGTDLELGLKQIVPAEVLETGVLTLPAKKLFEISGTSTATLQAIIAALKGDGAAVGYSVAYPFGVAGPILCIYALNAILKPKN